MTDHCEIHGFHRDGCPQCIEAKRALDASQKKDKAVTEEKPTEAESAT